MRNALAIYLEAVNLGKKVGWTKFCEASQGPRPFCCLR